MVGRHLEPCDVVRQDQPRLQALLRRATLSAVAGNAEQELQERLCGYVAAAHAIAPARMEVAKADLREQHERLIPRESAPLIYQAGLPRDESGRLAPVPNPDQTSGALEKTE